MKTLRLMFMGIIKKKNAQTIAKPIKRINEIVLSANNRITYVYKKIHAKQVIEVTCVSLEIKIQEKWITIIYYDSHHGGKLHRHTKIAFNDEADITDYANVKSRGSPASLLKWSINDIKHNFISYKRRFLQRNQVLLKDIEIDEY